MPQGALEDDSGNTGSLSTEERILYIGNEQPIRISSGHRIRHHEGKCARPHGHNYRISVEIRGQLAQEGWVVDKGQVTSIIEEWDHRFLLEKGDPLIEAFEQAGDGDAVVVLEHPPTAEVMAVILKRELEARLADNITGVSVTVAETAELCSG